MHGVDAARLAAALLGFAALIPQSAEANATPPPLHQGAEPVFASETLRIYRILDGQGRPRLLLTNLDEEGNRLAPEDEPVFMGANLDETDADLPAGLRVAEGADLPVASGPPHEEKEAGQREIHVDAGDENVVRVDDGNGTTIIININPPPTAAPLEPAVIPVAGVPWVGWGGITGPYRYPDKQPFLGYTPGVGSPSWFGGLGLNAGNGFGLSTSKPCGRGFDCMFPPTTPRP